jgi:hypothetical protein
MISDNDISMSNLSIIEKPTMIVNQVEEERKTYFPSGIKESHMLFRDSVFPVKMEIIKESNPIQIFIRSV